MITTNYQNPTGNLPKSDLALAHLPTKQTCRLGVRKSSKLVLSLPFANLCFLNFSFCKRAYLAESANFGFCAADHAAQRPPQHGSACARDIGSPPLTAPAYLQNTRSGKMLAYNAKTVGPTFAPRWPHEVPLMRHSAT